MAHRISRVTTGSGDRGRTSLATGARVPKTDARIEALGVVDELNAHLGALRASAPDADGGAVLESVQQELFDLGARLAGGAGAAPGPARLEAWIGEANAGLPPLAEFVLPGGNAAAAQCHIARTVCRRAERRVAALDDAGALVYLNRLSDLLFVLARRLARRDGAPEAQWEPGRRAG